MKKEELYVGQRFVCNDEAPDKFQGECGTIIEIYDYNDHPLVEFDENLGGGVVKGTKEGHGFYCPARMMNSLSEQDTKIEINFDSIL